MNKNIALLLLVLFLCIGTILPLLHSGFFDVHDNTQVVRVYEMGKMLAQKTFPVRWVPDLGYGYGYPIFNFYGPLPYYIGGVVTLLGINALISTKIMLGVGILLSAVTMFIFSRKFFGDVGGVVSAVVYSYFPYHAVNIYVRGAVGELFAYAFLPLIFYGIYAFIEDRKKFAMKEFLIMSYGVFFVATSHNLTFFMLLIILVPTIFLAYFFAKHRKYFAIAVVGALLVGVTLSSFYIVPAFSEMKYTNVASQIGGGADFRDHFVCLGQYWDSLWGFGGSVKGCIDGLSFKAGKLNVLLLIVSVLFLAYGFGKKKNDLQGKVAFISFVIIVISTILTLSISTIIWSTVPFMEYIQYPWRFINFTALFSAFVIGYVPYFVAKKQNNTVALYISICIIVGSIILGIKLFTPQYFNSNSSSYYTSQKYINFTVSKISDEYLPSGFIKPMSPSDLFESDIELYQGNGILRFAMKKYQSYVINYDFTTNGIVHLNRAYYPSWEAENNGKDIPIVADNKGMNMEIPKGKGILEIELKNTPLQSAANIISLIVFLSLPAAIIILSRRKK